jgi:hypothetical protein
MSASTARASDTATTIPARQVDQAWHPAWCSPKLCHTDVHAVIHESEPVSVGDLKISVHHPVAPNAVTSPTVCIETGPDDDDQFVQLHLNQAPALAGALLDLFTKA